MIRRSVRLAALACGLIEGAMVGSLLVAPAGRLLGIRELQRTHPEYCEAEAALVCIEAAIAKDGYARAG